MVTDQNGITTLSYLEGRMAHTACNSLTWPCAERCRSNTDTQAATCFTWGPHSHKMEAYMNDFMGFNDKLPSWKALTANHSIDKHQFILHHTRGVYSTSTMKDLSAFCYFYRIQACKFFFCQSNLAVGPCCNCECSCMEIAFLDVHYKQQPGKRLIITDTWLQLAGIMLRCSSKNCKEDKTCIVEALLQTHLHYSCIIREGRYPQAFHHDVRQVVWV